MTEPLRIGVVGSGIGRSHIEAYQSLPDLFEVAALCDIDHTRAAELAELFQIPRIITDFADFCRLDELDVIDICTPAHLHYPQALEALAAGKHVICEKPVAASLEQIDALIAAEAESGRRLMPIFQYRFGHGIQKLKLLVEAGVAGRAYLTTVETAWRRRPAYYAVPWRGKWETELGGALVSLAIHNHDLLHYVLGPIKNVFARAKTLVNTIEPEDCVSASMEMADGSLASLSVTTGSTVEISRHRFCFTNLTAESNTQPYHNSHEPWTFTGDSPEIEAQIEATLAHFEPLPERFPGQFYRYALALRANADLPVTLTDARTALELITALYHSVDTGRPVELPLSPDHPKYSGWRLEPGKLK